jgi:DNA-binding transcriptional regulator YhcF (GntR family)
MSTAKKKIFLGKKVSLAIIDYIIEADLALGDRLIPERDLATKFNVSVVTVRSALDMLAEDGIIEKRRGSGSYLLQRPKHLEHISAESQTSVALILKNEGDFYKALSGKICKELVAAGFDPILIPFSSEGDMDELVEEVRKLMRLGCGYMVVESDISLWQDPLLGQLGIYKDGNSLWRKIIWVGTRRDMPEFLPGDFLFTDLYQLNVDVIQNLKDMGCRDIILQSSQIDPHAVFPEWEFERINCFTRAMCTQGMAEGMRILAHTGDAAVDKQKAKALLKSCQLPIGVFASDDYRLVQILPAISELGLKIPDDVALVGDFNTPWSESFDFTSIDRNIDGFAQEVPRLLLDKGCEAVQQKYIPVEPKIVERKSCRVTTQRSC